MDTATVLIERVDLEHLHLPPRSIFDGERTAETAQVPCLPLWRGARRATVSLPVTESEAQILHRSYLIERFRGRVIVPLLLALAVVSVAWLGYSVIATDDRLDRLRPVPMIACAVLLLANVVLGEYLVPKQYPRIVRGDRIRIAAVPNAVVQEWEHLNPGVTLRERLDAG